MYTTDLQLQACIMRMYLVDAPTSCEVVHHSQPVQMVGVVYCAIPVLDTQMVHQRHDFQLALLDRALMRIALRCMGQSVHHRSVTI